MTHVISMFKTIVFCYFFLALCLVITACNTFRHFHMPLNAHWAVLWFIFFGSVFIYTGYALIKRPHKHTLALFQDQYKWYQEHPRTVVYVLLLTGFFCLCLAATLPYMWGCMGLLGCCIGAYPWLKKTIPYIKTGLVAFAYTLATVAMPLSCVPLWDPLMGIHAMCQFLLVFAITLIFDHRDCHEDMICGLKTCPMLFKDTTRLVSVTLLIIRLCILIVVTTPLSHVLIPVTTSVFVIYACWSPVVRWGNYYYSVFLESVLAIAGCI